MQTFWETYKFEGKAIPVKRWAADHWSTFAYLETRAVDNGGLIDNCKMRCNPRLHRELANTGGFGELIDGSKYPTRLKNHTVKKNVESSQTSSFVYKVWRMK